MFRVAPSATIPRVTPRIKHCVERATHFREGILQEVSKQKTADNSDRSRVATAFISMAAGDFKAILTEIGNDNNGPALKLFRFLYEDVINLSGFRHSPRTNLSRNCCTEKTDKYRAI